eukprot:gnl/Dysnectes_brevis/2821_a3442_1051.p1 GENE.gnl/Dysnectes_brevis/2821_a3442_1051~~gnl/Dysnectes_brevis/2821_a3442_1051.p1  ORF type:complete len:813 (+),score=183.17 gnl/Dysnectes_brevis/2821_a3442_1051:41-2440(+)
MHPSVAASRRLSQELFRARTADLKIKENESALQRFLVTWKDSVIPGKSLVLQNQRFGAESAKVLLKILNTFSFPLIDLSQNPLGSSILSLVPGFAKTGVIDLSLQSIALSLEDASAFISSIHPLNLHSLSLAPARGGGQRNRLGHKGGHALAAFIQSKSLLSLDVRGCSLGPEGVKAMAAGFDRSKLTVLNISGNDIGVAGGIALADELPNSSLVKLDVSGNALGDEGVSKILMAVQYCPTLGHLDMAGNRVRTGSRTQEALAGLLSLPSSARLAMEAEEATRLANETSKRQQWLHGLSPTVSRVAQRIKGEVEAANAPAPPAPAPTPPYTPIEIPKLKPAPAAKAPSGLRRGLTDPGEMAAAAGMTLTRRFLGPSACPLVSLDLSHNELSSVHFPPIAEALCDNDSLEELRLVSTSLDGEAFDFLANALRKNTTLRLLDLSSCPVRDMGTALLADSLGTNTALSTLLLESCNIGDIGGSALASSLHINSTLQEISLRNNHLSDVAGKAFLAALEPGASEAPLTQLELGLNRINYQTLRGIKTQMDIIHSEIERREVNRLTTELGTLRSEQQRIVELEEELVAVKQEREEAGASARESANALITTERTIEADCTAILSSITETQQQLRVTKNDLSHASRELSALKGEKEAQLRMLDARGAQCRDRKRRAGKVLKSEKRKQDDIHSSQHDKLAGLKAELAKLKFDIADVKRTGYYARTELVRMAELVHSKGLLEEKPVEMPSRRMRSRHTVSSEQVVLDEAKKLRAAAAKGKGKAKGARKKAVVKRGVKSGTKKSVSRRK